MGVPRGRGRCPHIAARKPRQRYCPACRADYMRDRRKDEVTQLKEIQIAWAAYLAERQGLEGMFASLQAVHRAITRRPRDGSATA